MTLTSARRFVIQRTEDPSGVSGTGIMLDGILWPDGTVTTHWRDPNGEGAWSNVFWPSIAAAESKHCYGGHSSIVWVDEADPDNTPAAMRPVGYAGAELAEPVMDFAAPAERPAEPVVGPPPVDRGLRSMRHPVTTPGPSPDAS